jgi:hypothetical protein
MQSLRVALEEPARSCVEMLLLTDDAERVMSKLKKKLQKYNGSYEPAAKRHQSIS